MAETPIRISEAFLYKEIMNLSDLLNCFRRERECLVNLDLDALWDISREKEEICSKMDSDRRALGLGRGAGAGERASLGGRTMALVPDADRAELENLLDTAEGLKGEVEAMRKENLSLIDHSLQFLDGMISIITGEAYTQVSYNGKCQVNRVGTSLLLSREA